MRALLLTAFAAAAFVAVPQATATEHRCEGHFDYACTDPSGAFCTLWLRGCQVGT